MKKLVIPVAKSQLQNSVEFLMTGSVLSSRLENKHSICQTVFSPYLIHLCQLPFLLLQKGQAYEKEVKDHYVNLFRQPFLKRQNINFFLILTDEPGSLFSLTSPL